MLCYVMLCYVMLCYVMLYYIILYYIIFYYIVLYCIVLYCIVLYYTISTLKCTITAIDEYKYPAFLYNLRPGQSNFCNRLQTMLFS